MGLKVHRHKNQSGKTDVIVDRKNLSEGVLTVKEPSDPNDRNTKGQFVKGNVACKKSRNKLFAKSLIEKLPCRNAGDPILQKYAKAAALLRNSVCKEYAKAAGGLCGVAPSALIAAAANQYAYANYLWALATDTADHELAGKASRLHNDSRQNLLAAWEIVVREAKARGDLHQSENITKTLANALTLDLPEVPKKVKKMMAPDADKTNT